MQQLALLHPVGPQPDVTLLRELLTVILTEQPVNSCSSPTPPWSCGLGPADPWSRLGADLQAAARAVIAAWQDGHVKGVRVAGLTAEEALALERPAMAWYAPARPPAAAPTRPRVRALAAGPIQRPPVRRPVSVAVDTRRRLQCPQRTPNRPSGHWLRFRNQQWTADTATASSRAATRHRRRIAMSAVGAARCLGRRQAAAGCPAQRQSPHSSCPLLVCAGQPGRSVSLPISTTSAPRRGVRVSARKAVE